MDADRPLPESAPSVDASVADDGADTPAPPVVAVVLARSGSAHLEACLGALAESDYPDLTVLVMARGGTDLRARVAAVLPHAYVRASEGAGVAEAANLALSTVAGAPFLLLCHDDTVVDPGALRVLVAEAYRSNAAVVGPKVVDPERPEILREVGWSVDRFGVPHSEIVTDELDQEQHDAVRDVFFVSDVCMLVRADLFAALEGFDPGVDPGARALDLCWRARLAGARVIVAPDARVRHHADDGAEEQDPVIAQRHQVRVLLTSTSGVRLLWLAPIAFLIHMAEAVAFLLRRQRVRAGALVGAWTWNLRTLGSIRSSRARAQHARVVSDREIHALQFRGSARVAAYVTASLHAPDRVRALSERSREVADTTSARLRSVQGVVILATLALVAIGVRDLVFGRVAAVGTLAVWPGVGDLLRAFTSEWRAAGLGAHAPPPPAFVLAALLQVVTLGADGLGRTLLVVLAIPVGMLGTYRLGRRIAGPGWPAIAATIVYAVLPLPRNAIERGEIGSLVLYTAAPFIALAVLALAGLVEHRWPRRRIGALGAVAVAIAAAWWPLALLLPAVLAAGMLVSIPIARDRLEVGPLARSVGVVTGLGALLLVPWPVAFVASGDRAAALGITEPAVESFASLLRFATGGSGAGIGGFAFVVAALVATLLATGDAARWCVRWWGIALLAWSLAALPAWLGTSSPAPDGVIVPAALAVAMVIGIGFAAFLGEIRREGVGWRQIAAVGAGALLVLGGFGFIGDLGGGRFRQPQDDWVEAVSWMNLQRDRGPFRVLWIGSSDAVPGWVHRLDRQAYAVTDDGSGDLRDSLLPPGGAGERAIDGAVSSLLDARTTRLGRIVAPMAVRYVVLPTRVAPSSGGIAPGTGRVSLALRRQLDLRELQGVPGAVVYENTAWVPGDAVLGRPVLSGTGGFREVRGRVGDARTPAGTVLWSQQYAGGWKAEADRPGVVHRRAYGWTNTFVAPRGGVERVVFTWQWLRWPAILLEVLIAVWLARRILRRRRRPGRSVGIVSALAPAPASESTPETVT